MSDDSSDIAPDDDATDALLERPLTELTVDELMALKAAYDVALGQRGHGVAA